MRMSLTSREEIGRVGRGCYEETPADVEFRLNHTMCLRGCGWARTSLLLVVVLQTSWLAREISSAWSLSNWTRRSPSSPASKLRPTTANSRSVRLAVCLSVCPYVYPACCVSSSYISVRQHWSLVNNSAAIIIILRSLSTETAAVVVSGICR